MNGSQAFWLSKADWIKVLKGGAVAATGAALLAIASWMQALPDQFDFGAYEALAVVLCQMGVNAIRKFVTDTREKYLK